jgi:hypothetical protein
VPPPLVLPILGALAGVTAAVAYLCTALAIDLAAGDPKPNQWAGNFVFGLPILAAVLAVGGAAAGAIVSLSERRRTAGRRLGLREIVVAVVIGTVLGGAAAIWRSGQVVS